MSSFSLVTLELRTAQDGLHTPEAAVQLLTSLPNPPKGVMHFFSQAPTFFLEILNQGQVSYFFLTLPENYVEYLKGQLTANYPEILIKQLEHDPLQEFQSQQVPSIAGELRVASHTYFSLKTFKEFPESDPLSGVLSTLSKTQDGDLVLIQIGV